MSTHLLPPAVHVPSIPSATLFPTAWPVLCVGRDPSLLGKRVQALFHAGIVAQSLSPERAEDLAREQRSRIWILCTSIELPTLVFLAGSVRRHSPHSRLLLAEGPSPAGIETSLFHRVITGEEGAEVLAAKVRQLSA